MSITIPIYIYRSTKLLVIISAQITPDALPPSIGTRALQKGWPAKLLVTLEAPVDLAIGVIFGIPIDVLTL